MKIRLKKGNSCWYNKFVRNSDVKLDVYILGINKLKTALVDLRILRDVVKHEVFKRTVHDKLVKKLMLLRQIIEVM